MGRKELEFPSHQKFIKVTRPPDTEDVHYSILYDDLPKDIIQKAMQDVNETEESRTQGVRSLKEFMKKKELTCSDNEVLLSVLRNCKYDIKKSESKLVNFLKLRQMVGEKLAEYDIKDIEAGLDEQGIGVLPYRDAHGRVIFFTRPFEKIATYETDFIVISLLAGLLFILCLPMTSLLGVTFIADSNYSSIQIWYLLLKVYRGLLPNYTNIPLRIGRVEVVNGHFFVRWMYNAVRPILPRKIANRVSFLGEGFENLHKHYHPDILPNEFGGNSGPLSNTLYKKKILDFMQKLKAEHNYVNQ